MSTKVIPNSKLAALVAALRLASGIAAAGLTAPLFGATITVNTNADASPPAGACSLRLAIDNVNNHVTTHPECSPTGAYGNDTITFSPSVRTIFVASELQLNSSTVTTINGSGVVAVDGSGVTRVFRTDGHADFESLTIRNGYHPNSGGAIFNDGTTALNNCTLSGNSAPSGGGVLNTYKLTVTNSVLSGNTATGTGSLYGGGAISNGGSLTVSNSTLSGNRAANEGGAILTGTGYATFTMTGSTLMGNSAYLGGAISARFGAPSVVTATITNSTLVGNSLTTSKPNCSAIYSSGTLIVTNSTLSGNSSVSVLCGNGTGSLANTIIAGNTVSGAGCTTLNLNDNGGNIQDGTSCGFSVAAGSLPNTNPKLGSFGKYGGLTATKLPLVGSPAIDAITCANVPSTDQRGVTRPQGARCDIGAVERRVVEDAIFLDHFEGY